MFAGRSQHIHIIFTGEALVCKDPAMSVAKAKARARALFAVTSVQEVALLGSFATMFKYDYICRRCCDNPESQYLDASHYCAQCQEYYCRSCLRYACDHDLLGCHRVGLAGRLQQGQFTCQIHPGNHLDSFCGIHDSLCCAVCALVLHKCCPNFETSSRAEKRVKQNEELVVLRKEFFSLQKRVYTLRNKYPTTPETDKELLKNINDYRNAINTLLNEFEKNSREEMKEMKQKCVMRQQMNDFMKNQEIHHKLDTYSKHLIHLKIEKALDFDNKKNIPDINLDEIGCMG